MDLLFFGLVPLYISKTENLYFNDLSVSLRSDILDSTAPQRRMLAWFCAMNATLLTHRQGMLIWPALEVCKQHVCGQPLTRLVVKLYQLFPQEDL